MNELPGGSSCPIGRGKSRRREKSMMDLQDRSVCPTMEEVGEVVGNPAFGRFCAQIRDTYQCGERIEYSACSMERGWNVKYKKGGRALCTIYPREGYFTVMVVVGNKEKPAVEEMLPRCTPELRESYHRTNEGNGQRWLMIDLEDEGELYEDVFRLIQIRRKP